MDSQSKLSQGSGSTDGEWEGFLEEVTFLLVWVRDSTPSRGNGKGRGRENRHISPRASWPCQGVDGSEAPLVQSQLGNEAAGT